MFEVRQDGMEYETVAASQTGQVLGITGATGDVLNKLIIIPEAVTAGTIALLDGATSINVFITGTLPSLAPITLDLNLKSASGAWSLTTGASVHVIAIGNFS